MAYGRVTADSDTGEVLGLRLEGRTIDDIFLRRIGELPELRELELQRTELTDLSLIRLKRWPKLTTLTLEGRQFNDRSLDHIVPLRNLKSLHLKNTRISPDGLAKLRESLRGLKVTVSPLYIGTAAYVPQERE